MLTELMKRNESLSPIILFVMVEVTLSVCLLAGFFLERNLVVLLFCVGKLGLAPLWFWVFRLFQGIDYRSMFRVITIYKIIPLYMLCTFLGGNIVVWLVCLNRLVVLYLFSGTGLLRNSIATLVVFSTGWLAISGVIRSFSLVVFFVFYLFMLSSLLFSEKSTPKLIILLFYSGLPPLGSFFAKIFILASRSVGRGFLFVFLFSGLMVLTVWTFVSLATEKGLQLVALLLVILGVFVCH